MVAFNVKNKEELIYDLIFSEKLEFKIDIAEYVDINMMTLLRKLKLYSKSLK